MPTMIHRPALLAAALAASLGVAACGGVKLKPSSEAKAKVALSATADVNPDATGKASPIVVRVYKLKGDTAFSGADFFALFDDDMKVLGPDLIGRDEYVLTPSEQRTVEVVVPKTARFVGVIAAFRDIRNSQWRVLVPAPLKKNDVTLSVERARVMFAPTP
jgi:type VI secretion system protein VasD